MIPNKGIRIEELFCSGDFAKRRYALYDTTSILKFIESRWDLAPLGARDAAANDLTNAFDFSR